MKKFALMLMFVTLGALAQQPQTQTAPIYPVNAKYVNGVAPGYAPTAGSGLTLNLGGGTSNCAGTIATYAAGTLTMTASTVNYVYLNTSASCAPAVKTTAFTSSDIPIAQVTTSGSAITAIADVRTMFQEGGSGGGAGAPVNGVDSSATSITAACGQMIRADSTSAITVTLPGTISTGCSIGIARGASAGTLTVNPNGITYDGVTTQLGQGQSIFVWTDGTNYHSTNVLAPGTNCTLAQSTSAPVMTLNCTGGSTGATAPYPVVVISGDSDLMYSSTAPHLTTTGPTSCNGTTCTTTSTNSYVAGQWITFDNNTPGGWGCLAFSAVQVLSTGLSSSQFEFSEAQTLLPTYAGCTGTVAPFNTGGIIQDSNTMAGETAIKLPTLSANGTAVPTLYPYAIPGNTLTADAANFTARYGAVAPSSAHGALIINNGGANDLNTCESLTTMQTAAQSFWTQAHAANYDVMQITPIGGMTAFNAGVGCGENLGYVYDSFMLWELAQKCTDMNGSSACWDYMADAGDIVKDSNNTYLINNHPTPAANSVVASIIDKSVKSQVNYLDGPGPGANILHGTQVSLVPPASGATTLQAWAFTGGNPMLSVCQYGAAMWMSYVNTGVGTSYCQNWLSFNYSGTLGSVTIDSSLTFGFGAGLGDSQNCIACFSLDPSTNGPYGLNDTIDLGAKVYPSSSMQMNDTTLWLSNGGLKLHCWTADPTVLTNGQVWYNCTAGQLKGYFAGTTFCISGTGCSSGAAFPSTNGIVFNTSTTASRNATASDLASLAYVADSGTTNAYAAVLAYPISSYTSGLTVTINPGSTNTSTTPTLSVSGLSAITIVKPVSGSLVAPTANDIVSGTLATFKYDGAHFQLQNPQTGGGTTYSGISPIVVTGSTISCPTCSVSSGGTAVSLPGAASLGSVTFNGNIGLLCADTSGSGTAQSCTTTPSITPATGTCFTYTTTTANSGAALTLNIDSFGAKSVAVASGSGWTTALTASTSIPANKPMQMCYDGTNLDASGTGSAPSGGSSYPTPETHTASSSAELDFTSCFSSSYKSYVIKATNMQVATNGAVLLLQFGNSGTYDSSSIYSWAQPNTQLGGAGGLNQVSNGNGIAISLAASNTSGLASSAVPGNSLTLNVNDPLSTTAYKTVTGEGMGNYVGSGVYFYYFGGYYASNSAMNQFRIVPSTGVIASGQVTCQPQPQ